jgi:CelD/BcsL family acetyltransferase involved in cellulose biosynthesis
MAQIEDATRPRSYAHTTLKQIGDASRMSAESLDLKHGEVQPAAPRGKLGIRVLSSLDELEKLRPAWEELLSRYPQASIFSTWEWLAPWWRAFGAGQQLHVVAFEDSSSRLVALAPLSIGTRHAFGKTWKIMRLMGDGSGDSDNLDLPVASGYEEDFAESLLDHLGEQSRQWDSCQWNSMPENSPLALRLPAQLKKRKWPLVTTFTPCSSVPLPDAWDTYAKQLSAKERGKLGTRSRRLEKQHTVQYRRCSQIQELDRDLESLFDLHQLRWEADGLPGSFRSAERRRFYHDLASLLLSRNQLEFGLLELDAKVVAAQFAFRFGDTVYSLQEGFDPALAKDSVGYVLRAKVLRTLIAEGVRKYDFLGGISESKARWGAEVGRYSEFYFARPYTAASFYLRAKYELKKGKESLRRHAPPHVWALLHAVNMRIRGQRG